MEIKTSKVVIDLGDGQSLKLTIQQAHELRDLLCRHFPTYSGYYYYQPLTPYYYNTYTLGCLTTNAITTDSTNPPQNMQISMES